MTIVELREKRAKLWATMEGFLDTHRDRKGVKQGQVHFQIVCHSKTSEHILDILYIY